MKAHRETLGHWLIQRTTAAFSVPTILLANVSTFLLNILLLFRHIHVGIEEILAADHVHHEVTRNWILILLRIFLLVIIKDVFVLKQLEALHAIREHSRRGFQGLLFSQVGW